MLHKIESLVFILIFRQEKYTSDTIQFPAVHNFWARSLQEQNQARTLFGYVHLPTRPPERLFTSRHFNSPSQTNPMMRVAHMF